MKKKCERKIYKRQNKKIGDRKEGKDGRRYTERKTKK
jgi:hypothetical protein